MYLPDNCINSAYLIAAHLILELLKVSQKLQATICDVWNMMENVKKRAELCRI